MNKTVDRKQFTICCHVDDLKILQMIPKVVDGVLSHLTTKYGKVSSLSVSRGRMHDYLGMRLNYGTKVKVRITMPEHINIILDSSSYSINGIAKNPEDNHMFTVK